MFAIRFGLAAMLLGMLSAGPRPGLAQDAPAKTITQRQRVEHLLRRLAFSAPPETVAAVMAIGPDAWLAQQEHPEQIDDSGSTLETLPTSLNARGQLDDLFVFERAVTQHMVLTPRQLQAKLELHWLDHFAVGTAKVGDTAVMYHYDQTVRANALGNFTTLLTAVAREAAMLVWLDNNFNAGAGANENFAREVMQLYSMGLYKLNLDGSLKLGADGVPVANYTQADVQAIARAMTGYGEVYDTSDNNPQTRVSVQYFPANHYNGALHFLGAMRAVPADGTAIDYVINIITHQDSVAPFMARELLQRFATETPSAHYIAAVARVWRAAQDAPDQLAQVMTAIVNNPEFDAAYRGMPKQPAELLFGLMRQMPGVMQMTAQAKPGTTLLVNQSYLQQRLLWPDTVFSFYRPGELAALTNTGSTLAVTNVVARITNAAPSDPQTDCYIDIVALRRRMGGTDGGTIRTYLADALLDGGSQEERAILLDYLGAAPSDDRIIGAIWLLASSPDYAVN